MFDPVSQKVVEVYSECCLSDDTDSDNLAVFAQHLINKINARSTLYASCISFSPEEGRSSKGSRKFAFMHFVHKSLGYTDKVLSDAYLATTGAIEKEDLEALPDFRECMELEVVVATSVKQLDLRNRCKGIVKALKRM